MTSTRTSMRLAFVTAIALAAVVPAHGATDTGVILVATVDEPFEVLGERSPAGTLTLETVRAFTPTRMLGEVRIGDRHLGMVFAERSDDPRLEASRNAVLFRRNASGVLVLVGYAYRVPGTADRYRYQRIVPFPGTEPRRTSEVADFDDAPIVLLAAEIRR